MTARRLVICATAVALVASLASGCSNGPDPVVVGAVYPLSGSQGPGGVDEYRGVRLAADLVNEDGGIRGRPVMIRTVDIPLGDAAPDAVDRLHDQGIRLVLGAYGSTISLPAAREASSTGMLYWETGAVGNLAGVGNGGLVFRVSPMGQMLGGAAVSFVADQLAAKLHRTPRSLRFAVSEVDDEYGRAVAQGAIDEIRGRGLTLVGEFPYRLRTFDPAALVRRIAAAKPDVLFVSAYVEDAVALRRETVHQHLPLLASIGTSSSYCMPAFGAALRGDAVGLFASDKPDEGTIDPSALLPAARDLLARATERYARLYGEEMSAAALAGFSAGWALFHLVLPRARSLDPRDVAAAARATRIPAGGLPNGSGVRFAPPGRPDQGDNLLAASVIEEWLGVNRREVVWPPAFAEAPITVLPLAS